MEKFKLVPVGVVRHLEEGTLLEIYPEFAEAIDGLNEVDRILLLLWFHETDNPERRNILKVHPKGDTQSPLMGVFATRSPVRPNPIAIYNVRIIKIKDAKIFINEIDTFDGTPVVDIKHFVKKLDCPEEI